MKILHLNTSVGGGAGIAVKQLNKALLKERLVESQIITKDDFPVLANDLSFPKRLIRGLHWRWIQKEYKRYSILSDYQSFTNDIVPFKNAILRQLLEYDYDILHLHWIGGIVDYSVIPALAAKTPLCWTLHDRNPIIDGFHYRLDSTKYAMRYFDSLPFCDSRRSDFVAEIHRRKKRALAQVDEERLHVISPSKALMDEVASSQTLNKFPANLIPNGIDTDIFSLLNKHECRGILGIPVDKRVILYISHRLSNEYKGYQIFEEAMCLLTEKTDYVIVTVGEHNIFSFDIEHIDLGFIESQETLARVYNACDVLVNPTLEDNLPNTVIESLACGTPVIGSNVGGIPDMVRPNITGQLFNTGDAEDLADKIKLFFDVPNLMVQMSKICREVAIREYDSTVQARAYIELYKKILNEHE